MIIKLCDNTDYAYPLLSIWREDFEQFKAILEEYQKDEEYNFDDFIIKLKENGISVKELDFDEEIFF